MDTSPAEKSCDPQLLLEELPSHQWPLDQLGNYAESLHDVILEAEKQRTPDYWKMGMALSLARPQVKRGGWADFLESRRINSTRASKARAIYRTFSTAAEVANISVEEAYEQRQRRQSASRNSVEPSDQTKLLPLCDVLAQVQRHSESLIEGMAFDTPEKARQLLATVSQLIQQLQELEQELQRYL